MYNDYDKCYRIHDYNDIDIGNGSISVSIYLSQYILTHVYQIYSISKFYRHCKRRKMETVHMLILLFVLFTY